jgi:RNA polymerase sigma-70 factor, ECF subfamily
MEGIDGRTFAELARRSPEEALSRLWQAYYKRLVLYCSRFPLAAGLGAEDLAQEAILRAMERAGDYDPRRPLGAWLYPIARNLALDARRRGRRGAELEPVAAQGGDPEPGPEEVAIREDESAFLRRFIRGLPPEDGELCVLRLVEGLSFREAGRVMGRPEGTLKWRMSEIRSALAKEWEAEYGDD